MLTSRVALAVHRGRHDRFIDSPISPFVCLVLVPSSVLQPCRSLAGLDHVGGRRAGQRTQTRVCILAHMTTAALTSCALPPRGSHFIVELFLDDKRDRQSRSPAVPFVVGICTGAP